MVAFLSHLFETLRSTFSESPVVSGCPLAAPIEVCSFFHTYPHPAESSPYRHLVRQRDFYFLERMVGSAASVFG